MHNICLFLQRVIPVTIRQGVKALKNPVPKNEKHSHPIIISVRLSDWPILYSLLFYNNLTHGQYLPCFLVAV